MKFFEKTARRHISLNRKKSKWERTIVQWNMIRIIYLNICRSYGPVARPSYWLHPEGVSIWTHRKTQFKMGWAFTPNTRMKSIRGQLICFAHLLIQGWARCRHSFAKVKKLLIEHGGRVVDLDEAKLTHIVIDKRDISRRVELDRRTCKQVVLFLNLCDWINKQNGG